MFSPVEQAALLRLDDLRREVERERQSERAATGRASRAAPGEIGAALARLRDRVGQAGATGRAALAGPACGASIE
jgi:hypothetical protein